MEGYRNGQLPTKAGRLWQSNNKIWNNATGKNLASTSSSCPITLAPVSRIRATFIEILASAVACEVISVKEHTQFSPYFLTIDPDISPEYWEFVPTFSRSFRSPTRSCAKFSVKSVRLLQRCLDNTHLSSRSNTHSANASTFFAQLFLNLITN